MREYLSNNRIRIAVIAAVMLITLLLCTSSVFAATTERVLDKNITESIVVKTGDNLTLDLNGYTLTSNGSAAIEVESGATLTVKDSSAAQTGKIVGKTGKIFSGRAAGGCIYNAGTVNFESGTMTGTIYKDFLKDKGGAVYNTGTFNMSGGCIKDSTVSCEGAGIFNYGTVTLSGNAVIDGCKAMYGVGIYNQGSLYMKGNSCIKNCEGDGGGIAIYYTNDMYNGHCVLSENASVINCKNTDNRVAPIYSYNRKSEALIIKDNFLIKDCYVKTDESPENYGISTSNNGEVIIQGGIIACGIRGEGNCTIIEGFFVEKPKSEYVASKVSVMNLSTSNSMYKKYGVKYFAGDPVCTRGDSKYITVADAFQGAVTGTVTLLDDCYDNVFVNYSSSVTLDLNGYSLYPADASESTIIVEMGSTLTVKNSKPASGALYAGSGSPWFFDDIHCGGAIQNRGNLNVTSCRITSNGVDLSETLGGGLFNAYDADCVLGKDTVISGVTGPYVGGAIFNMDEITISGATISDCSANQGGGIANTGKLIIEGGTKIQNCSANEGGALWSEGDVTVQGESILQGANCIYAADGNLNFKESTFSGGAIRLSGINSAEIKNCSIDVTEIYFERCNVSFSNDGKVKDMGGIKGKIVFNSGSKAEINFPANSLGTIEGDISCVNSTLYFYNGIHIGNISSSGATIKFEGGWFSTDPTRFAGSGLIGKKNTEDAPDSRAPWTFRTLTFYLSDGSVMQGPFNTGSMTTVPKNIFAKKGFKFASWNTKADGSGKTYMPDDSIDFADGTVLYVQWVVDTAVARVATLKDPLEKWSDKKVTIYSDKLEIKEGLAPFTKYDYTITSWNTDPNGQGQNFPIGCILDFGKSLSVTLYAQWTKIERMNFNSEDTKFVTFKDPTGNNADFQFAANGSSVYLSANGFTKSGSNLAGWSDGTRVYREGERYYLSTETSDVLNAVWVEKGSSSFFSVGGEEEDPGQGTRIIPLEEEEGGGGGSASRGDSETHQVTYHDNAGNANDMIAKTYDDDTLVMFCYFSKSGYSFTEWNTKADGSGTSYKAGSVIYFNNSSSIDLYAQWEKNGGGGGDEPTKPRDPANPGGSGGNSGNKKTREDIERELEEYNKKKKEGDSKSEITETVDPVYGPTVPGISDVYAEKYYADAIEWALKYGITSGKETYVDENGNVVVVFGPEDGCTRAEMVTFIWRTMGRPAPKSTSVPFVDVKKGSYYYDAMVWAYENGIVYGYDATHFRPEITCSRAHAVTFLWRSLNSPSANTDSMPFKDVNTNNYFYEPVQWAVENGVTSGTTATTFSPNSTCTRAQIVTFLYRTYGDKIENMQKNANKQ